MCSGQFDILLLYLDFLEKYHSYSQLSVLAILPQMFIIVSGMFSMLSIKV